LLYPDFSEASSLDFAIVMGETKLEALVKPG
jgi:hypothetical protein